MPPTAQQATENVERNLGATQFDPVPQHDELAADRKANVICCGLAYALATTEALDCTVGEDS